MNIYLMLFLLLVSFNLEITDVNIRQTILLTDEGQQSLQQMIHTNEEAQKYWNQIQGEARPILNQAPRPLKVINYEGLLDTNPKRMDTEKSLEDMDKLGVLLFAYYGSQDKKYAEKAKDYVLAWASMYEATGNPINENKLEPLIHCYQVMKSYFSPKEKELVSKWMMSIAEAEINRGHIPNNNWRTKHIKLLGTIGLILQEQKYVQYAIENFKDYIGTALYGDGTSRDLHHRDAMSYHVSGLKPLLTCAISFDYFNEAINLDAFHYENTEGGSIKKSVDYVIPYAIGEKVYKQWVNTKVELDRQRAEAGLEKYQPGTPYDPKKSKEMFELAYYFDQDYGRIIHGLSEESYQKYDSWFLVLVDVAREVK